jgi:hypothetical protein
MERSGDARVEAKLKVLIRHLVTSFPETSILSRPVGEQYHVFVIVPYEGGPEKSIQVERALLREPSLTVDEFVSRLDGLHLPTVLQECARYDLGPHSWSSSVSGRCWRRTSVMAPEVLFDSRERAQVTMPYGPHPPSALGGGGGDREVWTNSA